MLPVSGIERDVYATSYAIDDDGSFDLPETYRFTEGLNHRVAETDYLEYPVHPRQVLVELRELSFATFGEGVMSFSMQSGPPISKGMFRTSYDESTGFGHFRPVEDIMRNPALRTQQLLDMLRFIPEPELAKFSISCLSKLVRD